MYRPWYGYIFLLILFGAYLTVQCRAFLFPLHLALTASVQASLPAGSEFTIKGSADKMSRVRINGQDITLDINGNFLQTVLVQKGLTRIEITATSRFGKVSKKEIMLVGK